MKKYVIIANLILLIWFFLDMIGLKIGDKYLVEQALIDDGIFFIIYLVAVILFVFKEKIGKYVLNVWLLMWFITQFFSHWIFTINGKGLNKINVFKDTIKLVDSTTRYVADVYHIVLHILILVAFITLNIYLFRKKHNNA